MTTPYSYSPVGLMKEFSALLAKESKAQADSAIVETEQQQQPPNNANRDDDSFVVAAIQLTASDLETSTLQGFWDRAQQAVIEAATTRGANLILLPELFLGPYFCQSVEPVLMGLAMEAESSFVISRMQQLARTHQVVLPISIYERKNNAQYNSVIMIDADGSILGTYRKSHIPDGIGYLEKYYFNPGDTGFKVWDTQVGKVGVAICWDQWFPEAARAMALQGADIILYPTAIGTEPNDPTYDSSDHWQRCMQGHAAANMIPVVASNRVGTEILLAEDGTEKQRITFYGRSFITDQVGAMVEEVPRTNTDPITILTSTIHPSDNRKARVPWGLFRDRRPELYRILQTSDGVTASK